MKKIFLATAIALSFAAQADCVMRSQTLTKVVGKIDDIADAMAGYGPSFGGNAHCSVKARVLYKGSWHDVYGDYEGPDVGRQEMCDNATEIAVRQFLATKEAKLLHDSRQMWCSDEDPLKVRTVQKGERIKISEVKPHPNANKQAFMYKGKECRWFIEDSVKTNDLYVWQGVACKVDDDWIVVDKF